MENEDMVKAWKQAKVHILYGRNLVIPKHLTIRLDYIGQQLTWREIHWFDEMEDLYGEGE